MANIELFAVDLSWDIVARFVPTYRLNGEMLPKDFANDFVKIAKEETKVWITYHILGATVLLEPHCFLVWAFGKFITLT